MKKLLSLLLVLALMLGALGGIAGADAAMSGIIAAASPNTAGSYASYTVQLLGAHVISPSGWVQVDFASSFVMTPGSVSPALVSINGSVTPSFVTIFGTSVYMQLSSSTTIPAGTISVVIQLSPAIKNPTAAGNYSISASTSADGPAATVISIGTTGITGLSAFVTPASTGAVASWSLSFATSATGALAVGQTITATFPAGTTLPALDAGRLDQDIIRSVLKCVVDHCDRLRLRTDNVCSRGHGDRHQRLWLREHPDSLDIRSPEHARSQATTLSSFRPRRTRSLLRRIRSRSQGRRSVQSPLPSVR